MAWYGSPMLMWRKLLALPRAEQALLLRAAVLMGVTRAAMWATPFATIHRVLRSYGSRPMLEQLPTPRIVWAVAAVARRLRPMRRSCLPEALVTSVLLRRYGHPADLRIGVRREKAGGTGLRAHAWVVSQGRVVMGSVDDLEAFAPLDQTNSAIVWDRAT